MARMNLALLSDEVVDETAGGASDEVVSEIANGPETDLAEVEAVNGDMQDVEAMTDQGEADADALDAAADAVGEAEADGGISAPAAEAIAILVNNIRARHGMSPTTALAKEAFASKTTRVQAGRLAVEGIKETAGKIWEYIVKMYEKVKAWVIKWWNNFFDGATKVKNRAEKLVKAAEGKMGQKIDAKNIKIIAPAWAEKLVVDNKIPDPKDQTLEARLVNKDARETELGDPTIVGAFDDVKEMLEAVGKAAEFKTASGKYFAKVRGIVAGKKSVKDKRIDIPEGTEVFLLNPFPGGKSLYMAVPKSIGEGMDSALGKTKMFISDDINAKPMTKLDIDALQPNQARHIAQSVLVLAKMMIHNNKGVDGLKKSFDDVTKACKRVGGNTQDEDTKKRAAIAQRCAKGTLSFVTSGMVGANSHLISVMNATLSWAAASLDLVSKGDTEDKEPEKLLG